MMDTQPKPKISQLDLGAQRTSLPFPAAADAAPSPATLPLEVGSPPAAAADASAEVDAPAPVTPGLTGAAVAVALLRYPNAIPDVGEEIARLSAANRALLADAASTPDLIMQSLAAQLAVLESLAMRLIIDAEQTTAEQRVPLLKLALVAQGAWLRTASALVSVRAGVAPAT